MFYTYILKSLSQDGAIYIGSTTNLEKRLDEHNTGKSPYTRRHMPWSIETCDSFRTLEKAEAFELYLKTNSGKAFLRKRLISEEFKRALAEFNNGRTSPAKLKAK